MNFNSRTHEQINQPDLHKTPVKPILKILNSEQYPLLGIFASWVRQDKSELSIHMKGDELVT